MPVLSTLLARYRNWLASDKKLRKLAVSLHYYFIRHKLWREVLDLNTKDKFTVIYKNNLWSNEESASGGGSTLKRTLKIRNQLPALLLANHVKSICAAVSGD